MFTLSETEGNNTEKAKSKISRVKRDNSEPTMGVEPMTFSLPRKRSTTEPRRQVYPERM